MFQEFYSVNQDPVSYQPSVCFEYLWIHFRCWEDIYSAWALLRIKYLQKDRKVIVFREGCQKVYEGALFSCWLSSQEKYYSQRYQGWKCTASRKYNQIMWLWMGSVCPNASEHSMWNTTLHCSWNSQKLVLWQ